MATHIMYERIAPEAPISDPTTVIKLLFNMKPSAQRAQPELSEPETQQDFYTALDFSKELDL